MATNQKIPEVSWITNRTTLTRMEWVIFLDSLRKKRNESFVLRVYLWNGAALHSCRFGSIAADHIDYKWVGKEISDNLHDIYIYFEISNFNQIAKIKSLMLENTIFIETTHNQSNIVLIEFEDNDYNLTFTKDLNRQKILLTR